MTAIVYCSYHAGSMNKEERKKHLHAGGQEKRKLQKFTTQIREDLAKGKWLTDEHMNLVQSPVPPHQWLVKHCTFGK